VNLAAPLALSLVVSLFLCLAPAAATKLPSELTTTLKSTFPECRIRLDGAVEAKDGEVYLPILPKVESGAKVVRLKETFPAASGANSKADIYVFDDGYVYVRVLKTVNIKTFPSFAELPQKTHQGILSGHMPVDLIVPDRFSLPASLRPIVGEINITLLKELPTIEAPAAAGEEKNNAQPVTHAKGLGHGSIFVTSPSVGTITLVAEDTLKKIAEVPTEGTPGGMALSGEHLYIADQSKNRILILDVKGKNFLGQIDLPDKARPKSVVALPNGKLLYVSESGLGLVAVVEAETSKVLLTTKVPPGPSRMAITPDGATVLVLNVPTGQLTLISTQNQKVLGSVLVGTFPWAVTVAPDGAMAYVSCRSAGYVAIVDIAQKKMLGGIKTGNAPTGLAIDAEGKKLYVALAKDNKIAIFDLATRALVKEIALPPEVDFPGMICLLPGDKKLVVSSESTEAIGILNVEKGEFEEKPIIGHGTDETYFVPIN